MYTEKNRFYTLEKLAEEDSIYQTWHHAYLDAKRAFTVFANSQPEEVRSILYADCGRMALQRKLNLACQHMRFPEELSS